MRTIEQAVRDVLAAAVRAGLVVPARGDRPPRDLIPSDLVEPANVLRGYLAERLTESSPDQSRPR